MKRFASHFLFLPAYGYLKQYVVETEEGVVTRLFPLTEEIEDVEWLPGAIILLTQDELIKNDINSILAKASQDYSRMSERTAPPPSIDEARGLLPVYFSNFDVITMMPVAGTRHRQLL